MPSSSGGWGSTPEWATTGRVRVGLLEGPLDRAVEHRLVPRRQLLGGDEAAAAAACGSPAGLDRRGRAARCGRTRARSTGGGRAGRRPPAPGAPPACGPSGRSPTAGASPARAAGRPRRPRRRARGGRRGRGRAAGRARPRRPGPRRARSSSGVASASAMRVGPRLAPLRNRRSPLTERDPAPGRTGAGPMRRVAVADWRRSVVGRRSSAPSTVAPRRHVVERLVAERAGPPEARVGDGRRPADLVLARRRAVRSDSASMPADGRANRHGAGAGRCRARPRTPRTARSAVASRHRTRRRPMRTGPVSSTCTGRQMPPGFQSGSMPSQCWKTPVMLRLARAVALGGAGDLDAERVLVAVRARASVTSKRVGEEVALGVAQVGAVEPDVGLVEDAVEGDHQRRSSAAGSACSNRVRYSSGPSVSAKAGVDRQ